MNKTHLDKARASIANAIQRFTDYMARFKSGLPSEHFRTWSMAHSMSCDCVEAVEALKAFEEDAVSTKNKDMNEPVNTPCNTPMCGTEPARDTVPPLRKLTDHKDGGALNDDLHITVVDSPGFGGASHVYSIAYGFNPGTDVGGSQEKCRIEFQTGPVPEHGVNGISQEALLAIVIDRLRSFQSGQFACRENALALTKLEEALHWLQHRTRDRINRGVLGTLSK